jgi:copper chaperone CopZ
MQTELLKITGMTCGGCTNNVTQALKAVNGVEDVKVSLSAHEATVQFDDKLTTLDQLKSAVITAGYGIADANASQKPEGNGCGSGCGCG